jgi:hypothetical protein
LCQDKPLCERVGDFVTINNVNLADGLKSVDTGSITLPDLHHLKRKYVLKKEVPYNGEKKGMTYLSEAPFAYHSDKFKVVDGQRLSVARLICHSNLDFASSPNDLVPLILTAHSIEVGNEFDSAQEYVIAKVICEAISTSFGLFRSQVAL